MANQRAFTRIALPASASLDLADGSKAVGEVQDMSVGGFRIGSLAEPAVGTVGDVTIVFGSGPDSLVIHGRGHVTRVGGGAIALAFDELDLDGYHAISRLVMYNAPDADVVEEELQHHVGLKRRQG